MRKTRDEIADILFHAYELGDIDNVFYGGKWNKMSDTIKKELDKIELEDLGTIKENSYGVILWRPHHEINRNFIFSMLTENEEKNILPEITSLQFMIAEKYFTVYKNGKKITASLYATPQKMNELTQPLAYEIEQIKKDSPEYYNIRSLGWKIAIYNPFFYALKKEFPNTPIRDLCLVIEDYLNQTYKISQELIERSQVYNNIKNWTDLFPRTKKDLEPLITFARKRITAPQFIQTPNNNATNGIIAALVKPSVIGQVDMNNNLEITVSRNLKLTFEDIKDIQTPKTVNGMKLFVILLQKYIEHPNENGDVQIPLSEIQSLFGFADYATTWRAIRKAIDELSKIGFEIKDKNKSSGYIRLNAGIFFIKKGMLYWRFTQEFIPWIIGKGNYIADVPKEVLSTKNSNTFYLWYYISIDHRRNLGTSRKITVKSLINCCPDINEAYQKGDRPRQFAMKPLVEGLEAMDAYYFDWYDPTGNKVDDIWQLKTEDFFNSSIMVDFSDFPKHEKLLKQRETRKRQQQAAYDREQAKRKIKEEQAAANENI